MAPRKAINAYKQLSDRPVYPVDDSFFETRGVCCVMSIDRSMSDDRIDLEVKYDAMFECTL